MIDKHFFDDPEWYQIWGSDWSLLTCSYWGEEYTRTFWVGHITFLDKAVFVIRNGNNACYTPTASRNRFGKYIADKVEADHRFADIWSEWLKVEADRIRGFIAQYRGKDISYKMYKHYFDIHYDYYMPHIYIKYAVDYMKTETLEKLLPTFEDARVYAEPVFKETEEFITELAQVISKKSGYASELILHTVKEEFHQWFENGILPPKALLEERVQGCVLLYDRDISELRTGQAAFEVENLLVGQKDQTTLRGMTAYPGIVTGVVRLVPNPHNVKEFNDGDILVATMTRPEYLPLMKKAAAFVTDSGGILSHAAIVARELKKPCVIGTQKATKVLHDGDTVEVNADKGVVKKLT